MQDELLLENMMQMAKKAGTENAEVHSFMPFTNILLSFKNYNNRHVLKEKIDSESKENALFLSTVRIDGH